LCSAQESSARQYNDSKLAAFANETKSFPRAFAMLDELAPINGEEVILAAQMVAIRQIAKK